MRILNESVNFNKLPKPTNNTNFEGFNTSKVADGYSNYQEFLDNPEVAKEKGFTDVYVTEMTPQEYMDLCRLYVATNTEDDLDKLTDMNSEYKNFAKTCHEYAEKMKSGENFPLLILDTHWKEQDGRHRAGAAYINGYDKVPVLLCY
ncbi:MAG: hypothetical protein IJG68_05765 [Bacilli bacterium]|nr:hypothetical protein [Bacilli bacterium]